MGSIEYVDFGGTGSDTCNNTEYPSTFKYNGTIVPSPTVTGSMMIEVIGEITGRQLPATHRHVRDRLHAGVSRAHARRDR